VNLIEKRGVFLQEKPLFSFKNRHIFFRQNNPSLNRIYDDNGKVEGVIETIYEYNKTGISTKVI